MKEGWEIKKLGEVVSFQRGLTYSKDDEVESSGSCVLRSNNIDLETMTIVLDELKYIREDFFVSEDKKVRPNTILICMSNGSKQHLGKVAHIDTDYGYAFGGFMGLLNPNLKIVNSKYVYYSCLSPSYKYFLMGIGNGANITNLKFSDLSDFPIPVPPLPTQERIVSELDCINSIIEKKREQLKELDALAQSIFYDMFGDPIHNEKGWEVRKLGEIYNFIDYRGKTPNKIDSGIPLITARNIRKGYIDYSIKEYISEEEFSQRQSRGVAQKGDLLFTTEAPMGFAAIADLEVFSTGQRLITFQAHCENVVNNRYALYQILSEQFQFELSKQATGATVKGIKGSKLECMTIPLPPLSLQQSFASKIEAIEKQKELIKRSIAEVETLLASRMQYYFG